MQYKFCVVHTMQWHEFRRDVSHVVVPCRNHLSYVCETSTNVTGYSLEHVPHSIYT